jgi:hypothetical protein
MLFLFFIGSFLDLYICFLFALFVFIVYIVLRCIFNFFFFIIIVIFLIVFFAYE